MPGDPVDSADGSPEGASDLGPRHRSITRSTTKKRSKVKAKLRNAIAGGVGAASIRVNAMLARDEYELVYAPWLAERADQYGIAEPAANIVARRTGTDESVNPDVADLVDLAIAVFAYVSKSLHRRFQLRRDISEGKVPAPVVVDAPDMQRDEEPADVPVG
jgi:hypothetical protein